jgi:hypothetical protein
VRKAVIDAEVILIDDPDVLHKLYELLAVFIYVFREKVLHMVEQFRQVLSLLEDNQGVLLHPGGYDMEDDVVAIVMIEIIGN